MNKKFTSLMAVGALLTGLAACGRAVADDAPVVEENVAHENGAEDVVTSATVTNDARLFHENFGAGGHWIGAATDNLTWDEDFIIEGDFFDKDTEANGHRRKLALYTQDDAHVVQDRFSLTAPRLIVRSPNTVVAKGTVIGDIYVEANGFELDDATVEGNIIFASQEYHDSANLDSGHVNGDISVE